VATGKRRDKLKKRGRPKRRDPVGKERGVGNPRKFRERKKKKNRVKKRGKYATRGGKILLLAEGPKYKKNSNLVPEREKGGREQTTMKEGKREEGIILAHPIEKTG